MKLKNRIFTLLICLLVFTSSVANNVLQFAAVKGKFNFDTKQSTITLYGVKDGQLESHSTTTLDKNNQFGFSVGIDEPGFYYIDYGQMNNLRRDQMIRLYLEPGLDFSINIDKNTYQLEGKKIGHNELVLEANKFNNELSHFTKLNAKEATYQYFFPYIQDKAQSRLEQLRAQMKTKDKDFNQLMKLALTTDFEHTLYSFFRLPRTEHPAKENRPEVYAEYAKSLKFSETNLLKLGNGFDLVNEYYFYAKWLQGAKESKVKKILDYVVVIDDLRLKELFLYKILASGNLKLEEYKEIESTVKKFLISEESKAFIVEYEKDQYSEVGQPGFMFSYDDVEGKSVSFNDFKGKYVYVDVWATWCAPCKNEIPYLKELEKLYENEAIEFVSVSVDESTDKEKWKTFVKNENLTGVQLMADKAFSSGITKNYQINAIPRFLLFDKEGKIISTDAMRPSEPALKKQLNELLQNKNN